MATRTITPNIPIGTALKSDDLGYYALNPSTIKVKERIVPVNGKGDARETIYESVGNPLDCPWTVRVSIKEIANMYKGSSISLKNQLPDKRGKSILVQVAGTATITEAEEGALSSVSYAPFRCWTVLETPSDALFDYTVCSKIIASVYGAIQRGSDTTNALDSNAGINNLIHGISEY